MISDSKQGGGYADQYPVDQNQVKYINDETEGERKIISKSDLITKTQLYILSLNGKFYHKKVF